MIPRREGVSENLGPILKSPEAFVLGLEVSFLGDFASLSLGFFLSLCLEFWNPGLAVWQSLKFTILYPCFYIGGVQRNKSPHYTTLPLTIKIPLTVRFQTQQLGFMPQKPTFLNSNSIRNARTFNTWVPGSGDWATTPHANELK